MAVDKGVLPGRTADSYSDGRQTGEVLPVDEHCTDILYCVEGRAFLRSELTQEGVTE